jgi:hypothetical protein
MPRVSLDENLSSNGWFVINILLKQNEYLTHSVKAAVAPILSRLLDLTVANIHWFQVIALCDRMDQAAGLGAGCYLPAVLHHSQRHG